MDKTSELDCFLYYMWNAWDCWENDKVFGECASEAVEDPNNPGQMVVGSDLIIVRCWKTTSSASKIKLNQLRDL